MPERYAFIQFKDELRRAGIVAEFAKDSRSRFAQQLYNLRRRINKSAASGKQKFVAKAQQELLTLQALPFAYDFQAHTPVPWPVLAQKV